jgi:ribosomal silencing factor RsfS
MQTTELPLEEIDYDEAYAYDVAVLEARLKQKSIVPQSVIVAATGLRQSVAAVTNNVQKSLAPAGREEAKKELRDMRRTSMHGLALLFRKAADLLDAHA